MAFNPGGGGGSLSASPDVTLNTPVNGQPLVYNQSTAKWNNTAIPVTQVAGLANVAKTGNYSDITSRPTIPSTASQVGAVSLGGGTGKLWLGGTTQPAGMAIGDYWMHEISEAGTDTPPSTPLGISGSWALDFSDEFSGTSLDLTKWRPNRWGQTGDIYTNDAPFNPSLESAYFDPDNVTVANGECTFKIKPEAPTTINGNTYTYSSGMLSSQGLYSFPRGHYIEGRIFIPHGDGSDGTGLWPAFWTHSVNQWPPEIDIFEFFNTASSGSARPKFNYHYNSGGYQQLSPQAYGDTGTDYRGSWHVFGMYRQTNGNITPYVDGVAYPSAGVTNGIGDTEQHFILINLSCYREHPTGTVSAPRNGAEMKVDWVRVWRPA